MSALVSEDLCAQAAGGVSDWLERKVCQTGRHLSGYPALQLPSI